MDTTKYELVSSFYGPGAIGCWLLVISSIFIAWILDPIRRAKDTIDNDLLAAVTFPAIAAGHTIYQIIHYPGGLLELARQNVFPEEHPNPAFIAIRVFDNVNDTSFCLSLSLLFIAIWHFRVRRAMVTAGLCLLVQFPQILVADIGIPVVMLKDPDKLLPWWSKAIVLAQSSPVLMLYAIFLVAYVAMLALVGSLLLARSRIPQQDTGLDTTLQGTDGSSQDASKQEAMFGPSLLRGLILVPLALPLFPGISFHFTFSPTFRMQVSLGESYTIPKICLRSPVPPSGQALWTLDQTATLAGGVVTFIMTLYQAIKHKRAVVKVKQPSRDEHGDRLLRTWPVHRQ